MFRSFKFTILVILLLSLLIFSSCIDRLYGFETDYATGVILTPEIIESIINADTVVYVEKYTYETDDSGELIVYWIRGGSVWHAAKECSVLERASAEQIVSGNVADAANDGKERPCKLCSEDIGVDYTEAKIAESTNLVVDETKEENPEISLNDHTVDDTQQVYWTKSGSVWHMNIDCSSLANTEKSNLYSGNAEDAAAAGKVRACKKCS